MRQGARVPEAASSVAPRSRRRRWPLVLVVGFAVGALALVAVVVTAGPIPAALLAAGAAALGTGFAMLRLRRRVRRLERSIDEATRRNGWYMRWLSATETQEYAIERWDEQATVSAAGDTVTEQWLTIMVGLTGMSFYRLRVNKSPQHRLAEADRAGVVLEARTFTGERVLGPRCEVSGVWQGDEFVAYVQLPRPLGADEILKLWLRWSWPGYNRELLAGSPDVLEWAGYREVALLTSRIVFARDCGLPAGFRLRPYPGSPSPVQRRAADGRVTLFMVGVRLPANHKIGFKLDARERDPVRRRGPPGGGRDAP